MRRFLPAIFAAAALLASAAPARAADLPVVSFLTGDSAPTDIVAAGRFQFFAEATGFIGRIAPDGTIIRYPTPLGAPYRLAIGPGGVIWYIVQGPMGRKPMLGRMTQDGAPLANSASMKWGAEALTTGPDGNVYVTAMQSVAKFSPSGQLLAEYDTQAHTATGIVSGPDGNLWIAGTSNVPTTNASIWRMSTTGTVKEFSSGVGPACTTKPNYDDCPYATDIAVGPDGALWYTLAAIGDGQLRDGGIGRISTSGSAVYQLLPKQSGPAGLITGPDNALYAVDAPRGKLIRILMFTGEMSETDIPSGGLGVHASLGHDGIAFGADGNLWTAGNAYDRVTRITPDVPARPTTGNLLVNADGETSYNRRADGPFTTAPLAGWATSPNFTAANVNPKSGSGTLWGGPANAQSYARQLVDVTAQSEAIDGPRRIATLDAQIGGYNGQADSGVVSARFLAADGTVLADMETAPVTPDDLGGVTGYAARSIKGLLPIGTKYIEVEALAKRAAGLSNDAYFDDLSLTVEPLPAPPAPGAGDDPTGQSPQGGSGTGGSGAGGPGTGTGPTSGPGTKPGTGGPGTSGPTAAIAILTAPKLSASTLKALASGGPTTTDPKAGVGASFTLSVGARITVRFDRNETGKRKAKACVAPAKAPKKAKACKRYVTRGSFAIDGAAGPNTIRLTGRVGGKKLPKGSYRVVITPAGGASTTLALRVR